VEDVGWGLQNLFETDLAEKRLAARADAELYRMVHGRKALLSIEPEGLK